MNTKFQLTFSVINRYKLDSNLESKTTLDINFYRKESIMAGVQPSKFYNYISEWKKIFVTRNNGTITQKFKLDSNITDEYYFSIVNSRNQLLDLTGRKFKIYGSLIDAKNVMHILFYSEDCTLEEQNTVMHFHINTYTSEYMEQVKNTKIIDLTIVEVDPTEENELPGEGQPDIDKDFTQVILRDEAIAYKRPYLEYQMPAEFFEKIIYSGNVPLTGEFGAGQDISLTIGSNGAAFGTGLIQTGNDQLVIGSFNEVDNTKVFVIGNGQNDTERSNVFTVDYNGNLEANAISATSLYVGGVQIGSDLNQKFEATSAWALDTFALKSEVPNISAGVGINVNVVDGVTWITNTGGSSGTGDKTYLNGTGLGLSTVSAEDAIYKFYVNTEWLSTTIDAQVSGQFDDLSIQVSANEEKIETISGTFNDYTKTVDLADYISANVISGYATTEWVEEQEYATTGAVNAASTTILDSLTAYALSTNVYNKTEVDNIVSAMATTGYVTGAVNDLATGAVATNTENIGLIDNRLTAVEADYTTSAQVSSIITGYNYITSSEIPDTYVQQDTLTAYATKEALDELSSATSGLPSRVEALETVSSSFALAENVYSKSVADETFATKGEIPTVSDLSAGMYEAISGDVETQITGKNYITSDALTGLATEQYVTEQVSGKADQSTVEGLSTALSSAITGVVDTLSTKADASALDDLATEADLQYVSGVVSAQAADITALKAVSGQVDYTTVYDMLSSGNTNTLTITKDDEAEKIVFTATGGGSGDKTYTGASGIIVDNINDVIGISATIPSVDGLASEQWVETNFLSTSYGTTITTNSEDIAAIKALTGDFALTSDVVDQITSTVDDTYISELGFMTESDVVDQITYTVDDSYISNLGFMTESDVDEKITSTVDDTYISDLGFTTQEETAILCGALSAAITGVVDDLSTNYLTEVDADQYYAAKNIEDEVTANTTDLTALKAISGDFASTSSSFALTSDVYSKTVADQTFATKGEISDFVDSEGVSSIVTGYNYATQTDLQTTSAAITGWVEEQGYGTGSAISAVGQLINDVGYVTEPRVSAIASGYAGGGGSSISSVYEMLSTITPNRLSLTKDNATGITVLSAASASSGGGGTEYQAGTGINIVEDTINCTIEDTADLTNSVGYITIDDVTNRQRIITNNQIYDPSIEIYQNQYIPVDSGIVLSAFTVNVSDLPTSAAVATFEEWVYATTALTGITIGSDLTLIGDLPNKFSGGCYQVFVRRIMKVENTTKQYISFAYQFEKPVVIEPVDPSGQNDYSTMPLTLVATEDGTVVTLKQYGEPYENSFQYSLDRGETWSNYTLETDINLDEGQTVSFRGSQSHLNKEPGDDQGQEVDNFYRIEVTDGFAKVEGNIMSLVNNASTITDDNQFRSLFGHSDSNPISNRITDASNLWLPDSISQYCYCRMFRDDEDAYLSAAPIFRSTSTAYGCYEEVTCNQHITKIKFCATSWQEGCDWDPVRSDTLSCIEVALSGDDFNWHDFVNRDGIFIRPYGSVAGTTFVQDEAEEENTWTILERRANGQLKYTDGTSYEGEDPFPPTSN